MRDAHAQERTVLSPSIQGTDTGYAQGQRGAEQVPGQDMGVGGPHRTQRAAPQGGIGGSIAKSQMVDNDRLA